MTRSFGDAPTGRLWARQHVKRLAPRIERAALRKLVMLDAAEVLDDLAVPPGNRLEGGTLMATIAPVHPGEVLLDEYLVPLEVTQHRLARSIGVPLRRINEIVHGKRRITADTALRLARYFATTDRFWLNLQTRYDLEMEKDHLAGALDQIQPLKSA